MKRIPLILATLALFAFASADLKQIQGTWKASSGLMNGSALPKTLIEKMLLKIKGNTYDYDEGNGHDLGTLKEIPGKSPLAMDVVGTKGPNKGHQYPAIYKLEGSTLTICYGLDGHRPKSFDGKGKGSTLVMKFNRAG